MKGARSAWIAVAGSFALWLFASLPNAYAADPREGQAGTPSTAEADSVSVWQALSAVTYLAVLAVIGYGVVRLVKGRQTLMRGSSARIKVIESRRITPSMTIVIAEIDGQRFVVATTPSGVAMEKLAVAPDA